jgi:hypothetical protein
MGHQNFEDLPCNEELVEYTLGTLARTAKKIAALPTDAREDAFDVAHQAYATSMHACRKDHAAAARWVARVMAGVRELVAAIDRTNGGKGQHATSAPNR